MANYEVPLNQQSVNIPLGLFIALSRIVLFDDDGAELWEYAKKGLDNKFEAMEKRELYRRFHDKNISPEQQEKARLEYLDKIGMNQSFRWSADIYNCEGVEKK